MRTTTEDIRRHINYIERHTDYKVVDGYAYYVGNKSCYTVMLGDEVKAVIISNSNSDVWDMLNPFWDEAFAVDYKRMEAQGGDE
jgi:hypothetical protein